MKHSAHTQSQILLVQTQKENVSITSPTDSFKNMALTDVSGQFQSPILRYQHYFTHKGRKVKTLFWWLIVNHCASLWLKDLLILCSGHEELRQKWAFIQDCNWTWFVINNDERLRIRVKEKIHPALQHDGGNGNHHQQTNGTHLFTFIHVLYISVT